MGFCKHCGNSTGKKRGSRCNTCISKVRRLQTKKKAVEYLGGKCSKCGYDSHLAALEFHHTDPNLKDLTIGTMMNRKWNSIVKELDKCIILCSNCHRIEHSKYEETASLVSEAAKSAKLRE